MYNYWIFLLLNVSLPSPDVKACRKTFFSQHFPLRWWNLHVLGSKKNYFLFGQRIQHEFFVVIILFSFGIFDINDLGFLINCFHLYVNCSDCGRMVVTGIYLKGSILHFGGILLLFVFEFFSHTYVVQI